MVLRYWLIFSNGVRYRKVLVTHLPVLLGMRLLELPSIQDKKASLEFST